MTRKEFLTELDRRLSTLSRKEADEHLNYYAEMLADRIEEGMTEEEAVASMESIDAIATRILGSRSFVPPKKNRSGIIALVAAITMLVVVVAAVIIGSVAYLLSFDRSTVREETLPAEIVSNSNSGSASNIVDSTTGFYESSSTVAGESSQSFRAEDITSIQIEWTSDNVTLEVWNEDTVLVEEYGDTPTMTCTLEGGTLHVKHMDSDVFITGSRTSGGLQINNDGIRWGSLEINNDGIYWGDAAIDNDGIRFGDAEINNNGVYWNGNAIDSTGIHISSDRSTSLTVYIPRSLAESGLDRLQVSAASANVDLAGINARELILTTVSGNSTVDGSYDDATVSTTSGEVFFTGSFSDGMFNTVSGDLDVITYHSPLSFSANSVSGEISLTMPENTGFTLEFDSVSGSFYSGDFLVSERGDTYKSGNGDAQFSVNTVSADLVLVSI